MACHYILSEEKQETHGQVLKTLATDMVYFRLPNLIVFTTTNITTSTAYGLLEKLVK
jgi:hypothetical protein